MFLVSTLALAFVLLILSTHEHQEQWVLAANTKKHGDIVIRQVQVNHGFLKISVDLGLELAERMRDTPMDVIAHIPAHSIRNSTLLPRLKMLKQQLLGLHVKLTVYVQQQEEEEKAACLRQEKNISAWSVQNQLHVFANCVPEASFREADMELNEFKRLVLEHKIRPSELDVRQLGRIKAGVALNVPPQKEGAAAAESNLVLLRARRKLNFTRIAFFAALPTPAHKLPAQVGVVIASQMDKRLDEAQHRFKIHTIQWRVVAIPSWFDARYRHMEVRVDPILFVEEGMFVGMFTSALPGLSLTTTTTTTTNAEYYRLAKPMSQEHFQRSLVLHMERMSDGSMPMFNVA